MVFELAPIRVNSVSPGVVGDSPKWDAIVKKGDNPFLNAMAARTPTRRLARMADVIDAVFFLLDNQSVNGVDVAVDGGIQVV
jgi:NAD(P)-dependent dehydrogenase (short-subunit alcohol dehydrogenase family)